MPPPIARTYSSHETATAAANELKNRGFSADSIHVVDAAASQGHDAALASVLKTGIAPSVAPIYAEKINKGEALVVVHPFFGKSLPATSILHSFDPTPTHVPEVESAHAFRSDADPGDAAPLSRLLGWPVLSSDPTPLSTYLKWPTLKSQPASSRTLNAIRKQSGDAAPLSKKLGMSVLSPRAAPLSTKLRLKPLCDCPAPLSSRFKWRVLIDDPTPLSTLLNLKVLLKHKTRPVRHVRYV